MNVTPIQEDVKMSDNRNDSTESHGNSDWDETTQFPPVAGEPESSNGSGISWNQDSVSPAGNQPGYDQASYGQAHYGRSEYGQQGFDQSIVGSKAVGQGRGVAVDGYRVDFVVSSKERQELFFV